MPIPKYGKHPAEISVDGAVAEIHDARRTTTGPYTLSDIQLTLIPKSAVNDALAPEWTFRGKLRGDALRSVEYDGHIGPHGDTADVQGRVVGLQFGPELCAQLPKELADPTAQLQALRAEFHASFQADYDSAARGLSRSVSTARFERGRIDDSRMPQVLNDVAGTFTADGDGLVVRDLTARNGQTWLKVDLERRGYDATSPMAIVVEARHLLIGRMWEDSLTPALRETWRSFCRPARSTSQAGWITTASAGSPAAN
ncbi:MAG: hypothetical protein QM811_10535 [Pirellulales bacterium]